MDRTPQMIGPGSTSAETVRLDEWISRHGPMWPAAALVMILDACSTASRLDARVLRTVIGSLNAAGVTRRPGGWTWVPVPTESDAHAVSDHEIVERLGAILFLALSGEARVDLFSTEPAWRTMLRTARPELSTAIVDLTLGALSVRRRRSLTLAVFARDVRQALGVERHPEPRIRRMTFAAGAVMAATLFAGGAWWSLTESRDRVGTNGLTTRETIRQDIIYELATTNALSDEHTTAIGLYDLWGQLWRARQSPDDPRVIWALAHGAWVRTLAGDQFTAEQLLGDAPDWLSRELGDQHPYTRAARLALAGTLAARGANQEAALLRERTTGAMRTLFQPAATDDDFLPGIPAPPGVIAHVSPNAPEREGFREQRDGGYIAPLTSIQRLIAGRDGWRLHLLATGACRTSVVVGNVPRRITVDILRSSDNQWQVRIEGATSPATLVGVPADSLHVSLVADKAGSLIVKSREETRLLAIDEKGDPANQPYALTFESGPSTASDNGPVASGCAVVWLEIRFPYQPGAKVTAPPVSP